MQPRFPRLLALAPLAALALSCSSPSAPLCTSGMSVTCGCTDGRVGAQTCGTDGVYGACVCTGSGIDAGPGTDAGPGMDAGPELDAGPDVDTGIDTDAGPLDLGTDAPLAPDAGADAGSPTAYASVYAGPFSTCAVRNDGHAYCWGASQTEDDTSCAPHTVALVMNNAAQLDDPYLLRCGLLRSGSIQCWGPRMLGMSATSPTTVVGLSDATEFDASGGATACALRSDGHVLCWGDASSGALGNGSLTSTPTPGFVTGLTTATHITSACCQCATNADGSADCWGNNHQGQLGNGTLADATTPIAVSGVTDAADIVAGGQSTCLLHSSGHVSCWGDNTYGQLGNGSSGTGVTTPTAVSGITDATQVSILWDHACALHADHTVSCWGYNASGQLGDGTFTDRSSPVTVAGIDDAVYVSTGNSHTCVIRSTGRVWCWGANHCGQLGDGTTVDDTTPTEVTALP